MALNNAYDDMRDAVADLRDHLSNTTYPNPLLEGVANLLLGHLVQVEKCLEILEHSVKEVRKE